MNTSTLEAHARFDMRARKITAETSVLVKIERTPEGEFIAWTPDGRVGPYPESQFARILHGIEQSATCGPSYPFKTHIRARTYRQ